MPRPTKVSLLAAKNRGATCSLPLFFNEKQNSKARVECQKLQAPLRLTVHFKYMMNIEKNLALARLMISSLEPFGYDHQHRCEQLVSKRKTRVGYASNIRQHVHGT